MLHGLRSETIGTWDDGNLNQRQELAKAFFPEGLVYRNELKSFEPANTVITEMIIRFLDQFDPLASPTGFEPVLPP
jgi:hypothetical protein